MDASADLLALLGGTPATRSSVSVDELFRMTSPPSAQTVANESRADSLLNLLSVSPPAQSSSVPETDLLSKLFGPLSSASTAEPFPRSASPAATQNNQPQSNEPIASTSKAPAAGPSPFDFVSPFDILAKASPSTPTGTNGVNRVASTPAAPVSSRARQSSASASEVKAASPRIASPIKALAADQSVLSDVTSAPGTPQRLDREVTSVVTSKWRTLAPEPFQQLDPLADEATSGGSTVEVTPITRFASAVHFARGNVLALPGQTIAYATKQGKIRVLDRATGARLLLRLHSETVVDLQASSVLTDGWVHVASCARDGRLVIWRIPPKFSERSARHELVAEITAASMTRFARLRWSPDGNRLAVVTTEGRLVILDLQSAAWKRAIGNGRVIAEHDAVVGQQTLPPAGFVDVDFSQDGRQVVLLANNEAGEARQLLVIDADRVEKTIKSATLQRSAHGSQLLSIIPGTVAVSFREGLDIELTSSVSQEQIALMLRAGDGSTSFSKAQWDNGSSTLIIANSAGVIYLLKLDVSALRFTSVQSLALGEPVISFVKQDGDESLFCLLASGISQVHLPEPLPDENEATTVAEASAEASVEEQAPATDVAGAIKVVEETIVVSDHETPSPLLPVPSSSKEGASRALNGHFDASSMPGELMQSLEKWIKELGQEQEKRWASDKAEELQRQEQVLQTVSQTLTRNTSRVIDATIRQELQQTLVPEMQRSLQATVNSEVMNGVNESVRQALPGVIEKIFQRPEVSTLLAKQITLSAKTVIQETVAHIVSTQLGIGLQKATESAFDRLISEVRAEMTDIRKSIVSEQSDALTTLTADLAALRARLDAVPAQTTIEPARSVTPVQIWADRLLTALGDANQLQSVIMQTPPHHLEALFAKPSPLPLSTLLVLVFKLSEQLASAAPPLTPQSLTQVHWIVSACQAMNRNNGEPRVLAMMPDALNRCRVQYLTPLYEQLSRHGDARGAFAVGEAVRAIHDALQRP